MPDVAPRLQPSCAEDEAFLLGMMMVSEAAAKSLLLNLTTDDFYVTANRCIFSLMQMLASEGEPLPLSNVALTRRAQYLRLAHVPASTIAECLVGVWANSPYHAEFLRVRNACQKRQLMALCERVSEMLAHDHPIQEALDAWQDALADINPRTIERPRGLKYE